MDLTQEPDSSPARETDNQALAAKKRLKSLIAKARLVLLIEQVWRAGLSLFLVLCLFFALSFAGLWLELPHWGRALGLALFGLLTLFSLWPWTKIRWPSRQKALARIDRASDTPHRPAEAVEDQLANQSDDPLTQGFWALHKKRAAAAIAALRVGPPSPRLAEVDRFSVRAGMVFVLIALGIISGPEKYARVAAAFDWQLGNTESRGARLDAWVNPPPYTGMAPFLLNANTQDPKAPGSNGTIEAPIRSEIIIRYAGGGASVAASGNMIEVQPDDPGPEAKAKQAPNPDEGEKRLVLRGDATLDLKLNNQPRGSFSFHAIPDHPPVIALKGAPKANARGSLTLDYSIHDDYGVANAEAVFANPTLDGERIAEHPLGEAPKAALSLPPANNKGGDAETIAELGDHPWAGARMSLVLRAIDEGGNEGRSEPALITLPQRAFLNPMARALAEQRRNLMLMPSTKARVEKSLKALMLGPEFFGTSAAIYLGLQNAAERLEDAKSDQDLIDTGDFLWEMALRIENGDLSEAEREMRAAEKELRDALDRHAPEAEMQKLTEALSKAMDKFLAELAEKNQKDAQESGDTGPSSERSVTPKQLQAMLDKMRDLSRSGDREGAQKMLEKLQNILENLQTAKRKPQNPAAKAAKKALDELGKMTKDQQNLRDETYRNPEDQDKDQAQQDPAQDQNAQHKPQRGSKPQRSGQNAPLFPNGEEQDAGKGRDLSDQEAKQLSGRQKALRDRLAKVQKDLSQIGKGDESLGAASEAMKNAEDALGQGAEGQDDAVDAQGRALDALQKGAQKLAESMQGQGEGQGQGDASDQEGEGQDGEGEGQPGQGQRTGGNDPLGRPMASNPNVNPNAKFDPLGLPPAQRAQRILEELRRRLSDPSRPQEETDYLERLLKPF